MGRASGAGRVLLWAAVALVVVAALLGAAPGRAVAQAGDGGAFSDDDGSVHEPALDALASQGVLVGMECGEGLICPSESLRRWEMAVWLVRVLDGADPVGVDTERFADVDYEAWWAPFVERLFELEVTVGCGRDPLRYCPDDPVTRAQMATFLTRAFDLDPAPSAGFADVSGGSHAASIDALAAAGITVGCSRDPLQYCPGRSVTRAQMATFLARASGQVELPASMRFVAVEAGWWHTCGLRDDGSVACWGSNPFGQAIAPEGQFTEIAAGAHHSCGLRTDGSVECWGSNVVGQADAPPGPFTALAAGWGHTCGLRTDGSLDCWGVNWDGRAEPPDGQFKAVVVGDESSCGLRVDGSISCWGKPQGEIPPGQFDSIAVGRYYSCAVRTDGAIVCWGGHWIDHAESPQGRFSRVAVGGDHACGLHTDGTITCWGGNWLDQADPPPGQFIEVTAGDGHSCGLASGGTVICWGESGVDPSEAPAGTFTSIGVGSAHACGLRTDGVAVCWGNSVDRRSFPPPGSWIDIGVGLWHSCGVRTDGAVVCWGSDYQGQTRGPGGEFSAVSAGGHHSCGLLTDNTITCWGGTYSDQTKAPDGEFSAIASGLYHSCGLRSSGSIDCWGDNADGQASPPDGQYTAVSAGGHHSCALRTDGTVACWGSDHHGQSTEPDGQFEAISAGENHSCGVRADGAVACWGDDSWGQSTPPGGTFSAVAAGRRESCGLRPDGTIVCWGNPLVDPPSGVEDAVLPGRPDPHECRLFGVSGLTAGFPLPSWALPSTGAVGVAVIFIDFQDAAAGHSVDQEAELGLPYMERYLTSVSYGKLNMDLVVLTRWLRAEHSYRHYELAGAGLDYRISAEAVRLADPEIDFDGRRIAVVVMPSSHFGDGNALGDVDSDEGRVATVRINAFHVGDVRAPLAWGAIAAHEVTHLLGLLDLYPYDGRNQRPEPPAGKVWVDAEFGLMGLHGFFLADPEDPRLAYDVVNPDGSRYTAHRWHVHAREMLAWSRWQLGWLEEGQVRCVTEQETTVQLQPVASPGDGIAMAAVPLSDYEAIVVEARREMGFDSALELSAPDGARTTFPTLVTEGVLVYRVDSSVGNGQVPIKLPGDPGTGTIDDYPILTVGDSVTVSGYTITVVSDDGESHTVTIVKTGDG